MAAESDETNLYQWACSSGAVGSAMALWDFPSCLLDSQRSYSQGTNEMYAVVQALGKGGGLKIDTCAVGL